MSKQPVQQLESKELSQISVQISDYLSVDDSSNRNQEVKNMSELENKPKLQQASLIASDEGEQDSVADAKQRLQDCRKRLEGLGYHYSLMGDSDEDINIDHSQAGDQYLLEEADMAAHSVSVEDDTCDIKIPSGLAKDVVEHKSSFSASQHPRESFHNEQAAQENTRNLSKPSQQFLLQIASPVTPKLMSPQDCEVEKREDYQGSPSTNPFLQTFNMQQSHQMQVNQEASNCMSNVEELISIMNADSQQSMKGKEQEQSDWSRLERQGQELRDRLKEFDYLKLDQNERQPDANQLTEQVGYSQNTSQPTKVISRKVVRLEAIQLSIVNSSKKQQQYKSEDAKLENQNQVCLNKENVSFGNRQQIQQSNISKDQTERRIALTEIKVTTGDNQEFGDLQSKFTKPVPSKSRVISSDITPQPQPMNPNNQQFESPSRDTILEDLLDSLRRSAQNSKIDSPDLRQKLDCTLRGKNPASTLR